MTKVFIGGSRSITRLPGVVRERIDRLVVDGATVLVGDAGGADKAVQQYLHGRAYERVEVFCAEGECRHNVGGWPIRRVSADGGRGKRGFEFYAAKDRAMTGEAATGLMMWDGRSAGTLANVLRLLRQRKPVAVYFEADGTCRELRTEIDAQDLAARCPEPVRSRALREAAGGTREPEQRSLF